MSEELKPCPFCKDGDKLLSLYHCTAGSMNGLWRVGHGVCGFHTYAPTKEEALAKWNTRTAKKWKYAPSDWFATMGWNFGFDKIEKAFNAARETE